MIIRSARVLR